MEPIRVQDAQEEKGSMSRYREHDDESFDMKQTDKAATPTQDDKRPFRRVRSPSRPRAWLSYSHKPKFFRHFHKSPDEHPGYKPGFNSHKYHYSFHHRAFSYKRDPFRPKPHHITPPRGKDWDQGKEKDRYDSREKDWDRAKDQERYDSREKDWDRAKDQERYDPREKDWDRAKDQERYDPREKDWDQVKEKERYEPREKDWDQVKEKERYEPREKDWDRVKEEWYEPREKDWDRAKEEWYEPKESIDEGSSIKQGSTPSSFSSRSSRSRDKDMQFTIDRNQSRERDHRRSKSKDGERSRDRELPSTVSQTAARDRAIQKKRREIDEVYFQECEMFGVVTKMLIAKDPSLEQPIQSSLQENLKDIGERCVEAMKKFIEDYDSRGLSH
ncbi:unnamed protein product [Ophioblennius macclurei]